MPGLHDDLGYDTHFIYGKNGDLLFEDGPTPTNYIWLLPGDMAGITRGNDIYFRPGQYEEGTDAGTAILGHELVHVGQYREGMTWVSYLWSVRGGYSKQSKYEKPAYDMTDRITDDLSKVPPENRSKDGKNCGCGAQK